MRRTVPALLVVVVVSMGLTGCAFITRSSVSSNEDPGNGASGSSSLSGDGRYVAFTSAANNLVPNDATGFFPDVFVRDHQTGDTELVAVDSAGTQANADSGDPSISDDGRYVAFTSVATNLAPGDTNSEQDVFVRDRVAGTTERVSVDSTGTQGNSFSQTTSISGDGRYIAFSSNASNLVTGDTNGQIDVFVHDRDAGTTELVSVDSTGTQGNNSSLSPSLSDDGRYVAFDSFASNLVPGDTNGQVDVFVRDRVAGTTERVSIDSTGIEGNDASLLPSISADGRYVAFQSDASNLVTGDTGPRDVFVHDRTTGITQRVSLDAFYQQADHRSFDPSISEDGRYVTFSSLASNLVTGDTGIQDVFVKFALAPRPLGTSGPTSVARGTTGQVTITGAWLDPNALQVSVDPAAGVSVDSIVVGAPNTTAVITFTVAADADPGPRDLTVTNPGNAWNPDANAFDICFGCLTVT